ncbi:hypothetical protein H7E67_19440 [Clostridium gasigenes]|uniref:hypothetical protein n=1 Tax=Clostridium gasigenes TaxID=94869 RepID=UPI00162890F3|nr:hypothetical protein [Clostridium gasigenes]MBB6625577.1 hypothetical protein [Clostridium gasigenes]
MARGSQKIKVITGRDNELLKQLSKTGLCNSRQASEYAGVSLERLGKLEKSGYIRLSEHVVRGESCLIARLNNDGKEYCRQEFGTTMFPSAQSNHLEHDVKLTEVYYKLDHDIKDTWKHENELIKEYKELYPDQELKTFIDATIEVDGEVIALESVGDSYTSQVMAIKEEIAGAIGCARMERF